MTLRWKTVLIFGASLLGLLLVSYGAVSSILMGGFLKHEKEDAVQNVERVREAISDSLLTLDGKAWDWANWNDLYSFAGIGNPGFIEANLMDKTFVELRLNVILIFDSSRRLLFGKAFDLALEKEVPVPEALKATLERTSSILEHSDPDSSVTGLLGLPDGPMLIASRPILTSESKGPVRGAFIIGAYLNAGKIEYMARETRLDFSVESLPLRKPVVHEDVERALRFLSEKNPIVVQPLGEETVAGYCLLRDLSDLPVAVVRVLLPRAIYQQGRETLRYLILTLVVIGVVYSAATLLLLEKGVLARVILIVRKVHEIENKADARDRLAVSGGDELSTLVRAINGMLEALEASQDALRRANEELETRVSERTLELARANESLLAENLERRKAEELLRRSEAKYRELFMKAPIGIFQTSPEGKILTANPALADALGYDSPEVLTAHVADVAGQLYVDPLRRDALIEALLHSQSNGLFRFEGEFLRRDGAVVVAEIQGRVARDAEGSVLHLEGFAEDISERKRLEEVLRQARDNLEMLVEQRTIELNLKTQRLEEANAALKALLRQRDEDREEFEQTILSNVKNLVFPSLDKLKRSRLTGEQAACVETLESRIRRITSPFVRRLSQPFLGLTPTEIQVAEQVCSGKSTKEIADNLCLSESTVLFHRNNLRAKLGLKGKKANLRTYLQSLQ